MSRKDPFSTPARRRRIIAEFAKKTLRFYAVEACDGVVRYRIHTTAALVIQCRLRVFFALQKVERMRFARRSKAAIVMQCAIRQFLSRRRLKRSFSERLRRRQLRLNAAVHHLRDIRRQRLARIAMMIALRLAREKRERSAAINVQRVLRGHLARKMYRVMHAKHKEHLRKLNRAALSIQSRARSYLAVQRYQFWRTRLRSIAVVRRWVLGWWIRRRYKRNRAAKRMQQLVRGHLGRQRALREWQLREEQRSRISVLITDQLVLEAVNELVYRTAQEQVPQERNMVIHVDIGSELLSRWCTQGPAAVVLWCLEHSILEYRQLLGYRAGAVVQQVVRSVETALQQPGVPSIPGSDPTAVATGITDGQAALSAPDRVIALDKWEEGDTTDTPTGTRLPSGWGSIAYERYLNAASVGVAAGSAVSVERVNSERVELHIAACSEAGAYFLRSTVTVAFNRPSNDTSSVDISSTSTDVGVQDLKFRFKDALVYVNNPAPLPPSPPRPTAPAPPVREAVEEIAFDDESSLEDSSGEEDAEVTALTQPTAPVRPSTAVVRIVLRDPTPPPAPVDYDGKATTLQVRPHLSGWFLSV
jgi:hypothetical protein